MFGLRDDKLNYMTIRIRFGVGVFHSKAKWDHQWSGPWTGKQLTEESARMRRLHARAGRSTTTDARSDGVTLTLEPAVTWDCS